MKIRFEYFWGGFDPKDFFLLKYFNSPEIVTSDNYDYLILSVFPNKNININKFAKIIVFNGEHPDYIQTRIVALGIKPHIMIGFVDNNEYDFSTIKLYYPLWLLYYSDINQSTIDEIELKKNISIQDLCNKKFCCLINSHDINLTRTPIYNELSKINKIDCPGLLLNNINRQLVGSSSDDKINFMNSYIFNICSENRYGSGYLTEKLPQALNSACIPIYHGDLTDFHKKIFNQDRIILQIKLDSTSMVELKKTIKKLYGNKNHLFKFYKKPIFNSQALTEINKFKEDFEKKIIQLINI